MPNVTFTVSLDEQSKRTIEDLIGKLDFCGPIVPQTDRERNSLGVARVRAASECAPLPTMLLRMLSESENERERTHGFVGTIRSLEKTVRIVRTERDMFSGQVDHLMRQVDACHTKIQALRDELDLMSAKCSAYDDAKNRSVEMENEIGQLRKELSEANGRTRTACVRQMFVEVLPNEEHNDRPTVPSEAAIRLRTRIDAEEFVEKIDALYEDEDLVDLLKKILRAIATYSPIRKDLHDRLPEFADALADQAVTNEAFAIAFGIDLESVFREVHKSNMAKKGGPIDEHGKRHKPDGWTPPDVAGVLRFQGWRPSSETKVDEPIPYRIATNMPIAFRLEGSADAKNWRGAEPLSCELHGMIFGGGNECVRCAIARHDGSEVGPIDESDEGDRTREEPRVLMPGVTAISEKDGDPTYSMTFSTNDMAVAERYKLYMQNRTKVMPKPIGMSAYPVSFVEGVHVRPAKTCDRRYSIQIDFRKVP